MFPALSTRSLLSFLASSTLVLAAGSAGGEPAFADAAVGASLMTSCSRLSWVAGAGVPAPSHRSM